MEKTTVSCYTSGHPKPKVEWFFKDELISSTEDFYSLDNVLFVTGTSKTSGVLLCRAQNSFNNTVSTAESLALLATGDSRVLMAEVKASKNEVGKGETIELNCELTTSYDLAAPKFKWFDRNGEMIPDNHESKLNVEFNMLNEASSSTEFSCKAEDQELSIESNKAKIDIKRKLKKIEVN